LLTRGKLKNDKDEFVKDIPKLAEQICNVFREAGKSIYSAKSIEIKVDCSSLTSIDDLPQDTSIQGEVGLMEELFGTHNGKTDWKSVKDTFHGFPNSEEANLSALKEISRAVHCVCKNKKVLPILGTIFVEDGPKRYRPVISNAYRSSKGSVICQVLLVDDVGGQLQNVDEHLGALLTALRIAVRIRWEVIRPFTGRIEILSAENPRKLRLDLQTCFNNIFREGEFRGVYSSTNVWDAFDSSGDKSKFSTMQTNFPLTYEKIWKGIGFIDSTETYREVSDKPFSEEEIRSLDTGLCELEKMNKEFLEIAAPRASVLIQNEIGMTRP
jgi:hypothetical protein